MAASQHIDAGNRGACATVQMDWADTGDDIPVVIGELNPLNGDRGLGIDDSVLGNDVTENCSKSIGVRCLVERPIGIDKPVP